jgi:hypothetical protein
MTIQRHGLELVNAANRLAFGWMAAAADQQVTLTRRLLTEMTETARQAVSAEAPPERAQAMLDMLDRARELSLSTAREIGAMMQRMQGETAELLNQALTPPGEGEG